MELVERLKLITTNYSGNSSDYDEIFLRRAMKAIFTKENIKNPAKSESLFDLKQPERQFLRGKYVNEHNNKIISIAHVYFDFRFIFRTGRLRS